MVEYSEKSQWGGSGWQMAWYELSCFLDGVGFVRVRTQGRAGAVGKREGGALATGLRWVCPKRTLAWLS